MSTLHRYTCKGNIMTETNETSSELSEPCITKDSPYPIENDKLYLIEMSSKYYDPMKILVHGIHNASRQAYNMLRDLWEQGYYPYNPERHAGCADDYKKLKHSVQEQMSELESLLQNHQSNGETDKAFTIQKLIQLLKENYQTEGSALKARWDQEGFNREIYLLMQMPKEEAIRRTVLNGRVYKIIDVLKSRSNVEYEKFSCTEISISTPE